MIPALSLILWSAIFPLICFVALKPIKFPYNVYSAMVLNGIFLTGAFLIYSYCAILWK